MARLRQDVPEERASSTEGGVGGRAGLLRPLLTDTPRRDGAIMLLAFAGASVDAISYLALGRVFTANMTGNTVLLGLALVEGNRAALVRSGLAILGFMAGAVATAALLRRGKQPPQAERPAVAGLWLELAALGILAMLWYQAGPTPGNSALPALILIAGMAMGIQSAAVQHMHVRGISTTYITGMLTALTADLVVWLRQLEETSPGKVGGPALPALTWGTYALGAVIAVLVEQRWTAAALLLPAAGIVGALVVAALPTRARRPS
jgi:uncharacterized membrane protein YoaK (UPF0700 family)